MPPASPTVDPRHVRALVGAGPVCSVPCAAEDVDRYLAAWGELLETLVA
jgi:hypothetical protein